MGQLFTYNGPVTGTELIGRDGIIDEILAHLRRGQEVLVLAPRKYGKTSILKESLRRLRKEGYLTGFVDTFECAFQGEFAGRLVEAVLANETGKVKNLGKIARPFPNSLLNNTPLEDALSRFGVLQSLGMNEGAEVQRLGEVLNFPQLYAEAKGKRMVFAIDGVGEVSRWNGKLLGLMETTLKRHSQVTYLFSMNQERQRQAVYSPKTATFFGSAKVVVVPLLSETAVARYLIRTLRRGGFRIRLGVAKSIARMVASHPHYVKVLAQAVIDALPEQKRIIEEGDIDPGYRLALNYVRGELEQVWLNLGSAPFQRQVAKAMAVNGALPYSKKFFPQVDKAQIYFALSALERKGILKKEARGCYRFVNPFFPEFLREFER
ncbi:ATP-binding protein [candidate division KSB1 bacterium]|nr:ATP-binding protein [candidate division KSB1 bacterium]